jgi:hypothetical protein
VRCSRVMAASRDCVSLCRSAVGPEARPAPLYAAAGQSVSYLDLKDMGPPPEPSARYHCVCVCVCIYGCSCLCVSVFNAFASGTNRQPAAPWRPPQVPPSPAYQPRPNHRTCALFSRSPPPHPCPAASVIDSSKVASVRDMWQVSGSSASVVVFCCSLKRCFAAPR